MYNIGFIYCIENTVNHKKYIGQTKKNIQRRFKEHIEGSCYHDYPLSKAIRKYGSDNFIIYLLEKCPYEQIQEKEQYWIEYYNTYRDGYNATFGGDGTIRIDRQRVKELWDKGLSVGEIQTKLHHKENNISNILQEEFNVPYELIRQRKNKVIGKKLSKPVNMLDKNTGQFLRAFNSITEASTFLNAGDKGHISAVCQGKRKTAYGYKWEFAGDQNV